VAMVVAEVVVILCFVNLKFVRFVIFFLRSASTVIRVMSRVEIVANGSETHRRNVQQLR